MLSIKKKKISTFDQNKSTTVIIINNGNNTRSKDLLIQTELFTEVYLKQ